MKNYKVTRIKDGEKKPTRYFSSIQEKNVAKTFGGIVTKNSGATPFQKSDVLLDKVAVECKTQTKVKETFTIREGWMVKNEAEALFMGKPYSALSFNFGPGKKQYYIISEEMFEKLLEVL